MAITRPYPLTFLADVLPIQSVTWDSKRNDELSGTGGGRVWQAELADPLWMAKVVIDKDRHDVIKQLAAKVRSLHGAQYDFWLYDPLSKYPQADPAGVILGASTVQVHSVGEDRHTLRLKGLPASYQLTLADKGQVAFSTDPVLNFFFEFSEGVVADGSGVTPEFEVFPHVPIGVVADDAVTLAKPACKVFIMPGTASPGTARGPITDGSGFTVMERRR